MTATLPSPFSATDKPKAVVPGTERIAFSVYADDPPAARVNTYTAPAPLLVSGAPTSAMLPSPLSAMLRPNDVVLGAESVLCGPSVMLEPAAETPVATVNHGQSATASMAMTAQTWAR